MVRDSWSSLVEDRVSLTVMVRGMMDLAADSDEFEAHATGYLGSQARSNLQCISTTL